MGAVVELPKTPLVALVVNPDEPDRLGFLMRARAHSGLNKHRFEKLMGVAQGALTHWESGRYAVPKYVMRAAMAAAMLSGVTIQIVKPANHLYGKDI